MNFSLLIFSLLLSLINYAYTGSRYLTQGTKYDNWEYINLFRIPKEYISSFRSPGSYEMDLKSIFDDNFKTKWLSPEQGTKVKDPPTGIIYNPLKIINITVTFTKTVFIKNMVYQAWSLGNSKGIGYPDELNIYYSLQSGTNAKFTLVETISSKATDQKVYFIFSKIIECRQIILEWKVIHNAGAYPNKASAYEIIFLYPEYGNIDDTLINAFDSSDYKQLTLSQSYKNKNQNQMLLDLNKYQYNDYMKEYITRIVDIINGKLKYDPKREFTTIPKSGTNLVYNRGDLEKYSRMVLKMYYGVTDRQSMGIYARANEKITIFVRSSVDTDPLPKIQFTQYIGDFTGNVWLGKINELKLGKQTLVCDNFKLDNNLKIPTFPGGPLYLINPYNYTEQNPFFIYVEGGTLFPTYKIGGNKEKYLEELKECINLNKQNNKTYFDITELNSNKAMITVKASDAYKIYSNKNNISPNNNLESWDDFLEKLYTFDGIQFDEKQPYYNVNNKFLKIHYRYSQPSSDTALAYAYWEHVGLFKEDWIELALNFNMKTIGWGFPHETGHMMDINERIVKETSNNMLSKYYDAYLCGNNTWGLDHQENKIKYLTDDDTNDKLRGCIDINNPTNCKGFLTNRELNYLIWWDLESFHHGYWGELDNMYRFNNTLPAGITKEEKMVYFSSVIFHMDLGYYFTRWGLSFDKGETIFNENDASSVYNNLMSTALMKGIIDKRATKRKFWYLDNKQYNFKNIGNGCYSAQTTIQIASVIKGTNKYTIDLPKIRCDAHLGFEIYEKTKLIAFTYENQYIDETHYNTGYIPKYKIIAYDRLLNYSKESEYKSATNIDALNLINVNQILNK